MAVSPEKVRTDCQLTKKSAKTIAPTKIQLIE
jgi:hypothetical protein